MAEMTPKELMELVNLLAYPYEKRSPELEKAAVALRSYAELLSALEFLEDKSGVELVNNSLYPTELMSMARELGWAGLEGL